MAESIALKEYDSLTFDSSVFVRDGKVDFNPEAQVKGGVALRWSKGQVELQAGGAIGLIPLNGSLILEVTPRVPIARLEEIVRRSGSTPIIPLSYDRGYAPATQEFVAVDDLVASRFMDLLAELSFEGMYKEYARRRDRGASPRGRILPLPTMLSLRTSLRPQAHFGYFERTIDNEINQLILAAGLRLERILGERPNPPRRLIARLAALLVMFDGVRIVPEGQQWRIGVLPANRPVLGEVVGLSQLILLRGGVRFFGEDAVTLPSFLIDMETVFENYVRAVLQGSDRLAAFDVLDGNQQPPGGAASVIFEVAGPLGNHVTKPDLVMRRDGAIACVADVKYKPCSKQPDRPNLEQLIVYAVSYGAPKAMLMFPSALGQETAIEFLGHVRGIDCYKATLQLMNEALDDEEQRLCERLREMLN